MTVKVSAGFKKMVLATILFPTILLILGLYHGVLQAYYRGGLINDTSFWGLEYYQGLTLHGVINAIVFTTMVIVGFGHALIAYFLRKEPNLKVAWLSFWLMTIGVAMAAWAILAGKATVLYTFYAPLKAHTLFYLGATLLIIGSWIAFFSWIPVLRQWRKENHGKPVPLAVIGIFSTFIVWFVATLGVAAEVLIYLLPWSMGLMEEVDVPMTRLLFWFFGHPLVYFWLLPAYIMYYVFMPKLAGGKLYSEDAARLVFMLFIVFSIPVGVHHQFTEPGLSQSTKLLHSLITFAVAIPSLITAFTLAASLEYAGRQRGSTSLLGWMFKQPFFDKNNWFFAYLIVGLIIFIIGGFTGVVNASYNVNLVVHNTAWIPGHFHMTVGAPVALALMAIVLYLYSQLTGKDVKLKGLSLLVPYLWALGLIFMSFAMMYNGVVNAEPRRTNLGLTYLNPDSPLFKPEWVPYGKMVIIGGTLLGTAAIIYFVVLFATMFSKATREGGIISFPVAETVHGYSGSKWLDSFRPWIIILVILILVSYGLAIVDVIGSTYGTSPGYSPVSPVPIK